MWIFLGSGTSTKIFSGGIGFRDLVAVPLPLNVFGQVHKQLHYVIIITVACGDEYKGYYCHHYGE